MSIVKPEPRTALLTPEIERAWRGADLVPRGTTPDELEAFAATCLRLGLDPLAKQVYLVRRWDEKLGRERCTTQVSIEGFRAVAERTGQYRGQTDAEWCGPDGKWRDAWLEPGPPAAARIGVLREGFTAPLRKVARFRSYAQTNKSGQLTRMWATMPEVMIAKCFDEDTEVLTDEGFQRFSRVTGRVLEVTEQGLRPTNARPFAQDYDGPMVTLESDDLNFSVTPNHDMLTTEGKIEAGAMYERARARPQFWIPRSMQGSASGLGMSDAQIVLAAAYLCDGFDTSGASFDIAVKRPHKVEALRALALAAQEGTRETRPVVSKARIIIPSGRQTVFTFAFAQIEPLCASRKHIDRAAILAMSREQAALLVDSMVFFDGHANKRSGVRRFYTSRIAHREAFELACVVAGYAISGWSARTSDISTTPNYYATISARDAIPVIRWGRAYNNRATAKRNRTGLTLTESTGRVWCVTVPSGVVVVRRRGFSMLCGNCAEALALRAAFPNELGGLYTPDEMAQADSGAPLTVVSSAPAPVGLLGTTQQTPDGGFQAAQAPAQAAPRALPVPDGVPPDEARQEAPTWEALQEMCRGKLEACTTEADLSAWVTALGKQAVPGAARTVLWGMFSAHAKKLGFDPAKFAKQKGGR